MGARLSWACAPSPGGVRALARPAGRILPCDPHPRIVITLNSWYEYWFHNLRSLCAKRTHISAYLSLIIKNSRVLTAVVLSGSLEEQDSLRIDGSATRLVSGESMASAASQTSTGFWPAVRPYLPHPHGPGGFIPSETLVQNGTAGDNCTGGGPFYHRTRFSSRMKPPLGGISSGNPPPGCGVIRLKGLFSEGGEVKQLHIEGSLTIPTPGIKVHNYGNTKNRSSTGAPRIGGSFTSP